MLTHHDTYTLRLTITWSMAWASRCPHSAPPRSSQPLCRVGGCVQSCALTWWPAAASSSVARVVSWQRPSALSHRLPPPPRQRTRDGLQRSAGGLPQQGAAQAHGRSERPCTLCRHVGRRARTPESRGTACGGGSRSQDLIRVQGTGCTVAGLTSGWAERKGCAEPKERSSTSTHSLNVSTDWLTGRLTDWLTD